MYIDIYMDQPQKLLELALLAFFKHQLQLKMYHFQTKSYGAHKASDAYLETFADKLDKFMEVAQGPFGRLNMQAITLNFSVVNDNTIQQELDDFIKLLKEWNETYLSYPELLNIRDEMVADAEQLKYLLTFE